MCFSWTHTHRECTSSNRKCINCEEGTDHSTLAMSCPLRKIVSKKKRQEIIQSTNSHQYSSHYQATHSHSHPANSYSQVLAHSNSAGHSSSMTSVKANGGLIITIPIQSIPTLEKSSVSNAVISVLIATAKNCEEPGTFETVLNSLLWHHIFNYSVYLYPIVAWQTVYRIARRSLSFKSNCLQEKTNQKANKRKYIRTT